MLLRLTRMRREVAYTGGRLDAGDAVTRDFHGHGFPIWTLERPWQDNNPDTSCIPTGRYHVRKSMSPHLRYVTPELLNVPGRVGIRIHIANYVSQLEGCIAVGWVVDNIKPAVYNSKTAFDWLMEISPDEFDVEIVDG